MVLYGRARWKLESEHNNVLKNRGYNFQHTFGHGKNPEPEIFFILNLIEFQLHTIAGYVFLRDASRSALCSA
jgi:hypothetical protein